MSHFRGDIGIKQDVYERHRQWYGDLTGKKVLDFGCGRGNILMLEIARQSAEYLAIDISAAAIEAVQRKLAAQQIAHARAEVLDLLALDESEKYDLIYAHSVLHHFKHFGPVLEKLSKHLNDDGIVIAHDPMDTAPVVHVLRALYRPFQDDKDWEWPFTRQSIAEIQKYFRIAQVQGVLGHSKWAFPLYVVAPGMGRQRGQKAHQRDMLQATDLDRDLYRCMQVSMLLTKKS
ncbi:MAG: class I SAM-dependent methyltransferase [Chloroflexi bacterium]|nr:class I SAM-dependent methyltransferase [Chloroflexota bacterium]